MSSSKYFFIFFAQLKMWKVGKRQRRIKDWPGPKTDVKIGFHSDCVTTKRHQFEIQERKKKSDFFWLAFQLCLRLKSEMITSMYTKLQMHWRFLSQMFTFVFLVSQTISGYLRSFCISKKHKTFNFKRIKYSSWFWWNVFKIIMKFQSLVLN